MRTDIIDYIKKIIYERTQKQENKFGYGVYFHIEAVAKNGELLAKQFGADEEVVIIFITNMGRWTTIVGIGICIMIADLIWMKKPDKISWTPAAAMTSSRPTPL